MKGETVFHALEVKINTLMEQQHAKMVQKTVSLLNLEMESVCNVCLDMNHMKVMAQQAARNVMKDFTAMMVLSVFKHKIQDAD